MTWVLQNKSCPSWNFQTVYVTKLDPKFLNLLLLSFLLHFFLFYFFIPDRACAFFMAGFHIYCIFHCSQKNGWIQTVCVQNSSDKTLKPLLWKILSLFHLCESKTANISFSKTVVHFVQPCFPFFFGSCSLKRQYNHCSSQASCFHKVMYI